ncbi:glycosyltransferase [Thalassotalea piscium]|uniref:Glycosyltransferase involved in cell wall biosynthesis n=1 Tax=Thalassotalea piscium TaxID=1230533 RepID=A0A7X0NGA0_9GAMM|nr:glycosyltransferase [Thalassotalea piscium]MBB6542751.1 glycosyltransferase involved in cell wall biosynthesis [Thalassotalea piscium]
MDNTPLVSVYISTHNRSQLLLRALNSVFNQSYKNIEIIVGDDGSTDNTFNEIKPYIDSNRIRYVKNKTPKGACSVRNLAINIAEGEYITGLDDDDEFLPTRIEELVTHFTGSGYSCVTASICERTPAGDISRNFDAGEVSLDNLLHYDVLGNQVLTRTSYLKAIGGFDETMPAFQDYDTWVRLVDKFGNGFKLKNCSYILYSNHGGERISENNTKRIAGYKIFMDKHHNKMNKRHLDSMKLLELRLTNSPYSLLSFIKLTHRGNVFSSLAYFINTNLFWLKNIFYRVRTK